MQFLVLGIVSASSKSGREIRGRLEEFGSRTRGPAFYQLMSRLEDGGFVEGTYHQNVVEGQIIRERHYEITAEGVKAWSRSRDFYVKAIRDFGPLERPSSA